MQHWIRRSALAAVIVLSVAACAGDGGAEATVAPTTTTATSQAPTTATSQAPGSTTGAGGRVAKTHPPPWVSPLLRLRSKVLLHPISFSHWRTGPRFR